MREFLRFFCLFGVPFFIIAAVCIWNPRTDEKLGKPVADRVAWTLFVLGVILMATMALYGMTEDLRSWDTIQLHTRIFLALSLVLIAGPLIVYLIQATRKRPHVIPAKKPLIDDWDEAA